MSGLGTDRPLHETIDSLISKLEAIQSEKNYQLEDAAKITSNIDRLAEAIANLEMTRARENKLAQKLEVLTGQMEALTRSSYRGERSNVRSLESTLRTLIAGTRTVGQVIEIIANSAQVMFDSIIKTFNDYRVSTTGASERGGGEKTSHLATDLTRLLDPINTLLRSLAEQKASGHQPAAGEKEKRESGQ